MRDDCATICRMKHSLQAVGVKAVLALRHLVTQTFNICLSAYLSRMLSRMMSRDGGSMASLVVRCTGGAVGSVAEATFTKTARFAQRRYMLDLLNLVLTETNAPAERMLLADVSRMAGVALF